jgi:hypothetical protein
MTVLFLLRMLCLLRLVWILRLLYLSDGYYTSYEYHYTLIQDGHVVWVKLYSRIGKLFVRNSALHMMD